MPVSEFGPLLLSRVMGCTETQESVLQVVFKFADDQGLALLDLVDLVDVIRFLTSERGRDVQAEYGGMATSTLNVLLRKAMELDTQGAEQFFGEPTFDVHDLMRTRDGLGVISVMNLTDMQDQPKIFSTFMMWVLAELYETAPEVGRSRPAGAGVLLRRGPPAVQRCVQGDARRRGTDRSDDPVQGHRRVLRHAESD